MADPDMEAKVVDPCCRDPKKCYASYEKPKPANEALYKPIHRVFI